MRNKIFTAVILFIVISNFNGQIITTIAGNGIAGFSGDFGLATNAKIDSPCDVAADKFGNVYIADRNNSRVRKVDVFGNITTIAGTGAVGFSGDGGSAVSAHLGRPTGITLDSTGNIYILDRDNNRIRKISTAGIITTVAGNGSGGYTGDGGSALLASIGNGFGISSDKAGNIFLAEFSSHVIRKISTSGIITTVAGNGTSGNSGDGGLAINAQLNFPNWVAVDESGNLFISDMNNNKIRKVNTMGIISTFAGNIFGSPGFGGDGGLATSALLHQPQDVDIDIQGNVYVQDGINDRIRIINSSGIINTYAGNGTLGYSGDGGLAPYANLGGRSGICVDTYSNLYLAESYTNRIRKVSSIINLQFESESDSFSSFPNPVTTELCVKLAENENAVIQIIDSFGIVLMTCQFSNKKIIDTNNLSSGIYTLKVSNGRKVYTKRIIIRH